jgi:TolB-like protein/tetratricopeptide (TPR) repeat protein
MLYRVGDLELDQLKFELRRAGSSIAVEPQVLALIFLLVENRDRLITKDEIVERIWNGRIVSDSAVTSRVKSARQALGDDGLQQRAIRTVHGKGYRFVADVSLQLPARAEPPQSQPDTSFQVTGKPSIAVLPFRMVGCSAAASLMADALPHEIIADLARLRWLFVIARGSSFRFRSPVVDIRRIGQLLGVRYCLTGSIAADESRADVTVELSDTRDGGVIWAEHYSMPIRSIHEVRAQIVASVTIAMEIQIPLREAQLARQRSPEDLDSWSAYHVGLQHAFRFNKQDNAIAVGMFERAIAKDPGSARAHAGLSFAHFQNAFLSYVPDTVTAAREARSAAEHALEIDSLDPFANFTYGRAHWLESKVADSLVWLDRSVTLSPNYAQGRYGKAWAETLLGHSEEGQIQADAAITLSPIDPLLYAMLATRALTHLTRNESAAAACWGDDAARSPGAHVLVAIIAAICHLLNGETEKARNWVRAAKKRDPEVDQRRFFGAFPFEDTDVRDRISLALSSLGV